MEGDHRRHMWVQWGPDRRSKLAFAQQHIVDVFGDEVGSLQKANYHLAQMARAREIPIEYDLLRSLDKNEISKDIPNSSEGTDKDISVVGLIPEIDNLRN